MIFFTSFYGTVSKDLCLNVIGVFALQDFPFLSQLARVLIYRACDAERKWICKVRAEH
jgi:hypothetical protein